jgi:hypothetical protein
MQHGPAAREEEEENADRQRDSGGDRGRGRRALDGRLYEERADDPEEEEDRPAAGDDLVGESHVGWATRQEVIPTEEPNALRCDLAGQSFSAFIP